MKKMLLVHQSAELYGSDRSFLSIVKILSELDYDISILIPEDGPLVEKLRSFNVNIIIHNFGVLRKSSLKKNPLKHFGELIKGYIWSVSKVKEFDIVYINTIVNVTFLLPLFKNSLEKIVHVRELPSRSVTILYRFLFWLSKSKIIYNSIAVKENFKTSGAVIYNAVSTDVVHNKKDQDGISVLFVGRINDWKGADLLLDAILNLDNLALIKNFYVVGAPYPGQESNLENILAKSRKLVNCKFNYEGFVENPAYYYSICDIVIVPSKKPEPFGRVVIESMAFGNITVIADHGGMTEIIDDKINGFKFKPNSVEDLQRVILYIAENYHKLDAIKINAVNSYKSKFTIETLENNINDFFKK